MVTGAGTGVGRAAALALAREGWHVVAVGRREHLLAETAEECGRAGGSGSAIPADVSDPASVAALFDRVRSDHGRLDLLFNNAGRWPRACRSTSSGSRTGSASWT